MARHRIAFLAFLALATAWYAWRQPSTTVNGGKGWDGSQYSLLYSDFRTGARSPVQHPYAKRIGVPYLASRLPLPERQAFLLLNVGAGFVAIAFVFWMLSERLPAWVAWAASLPMCCHAFGPIRFPEFYPFTVDPPSAAALAIGAFLAARRQYVAGGLAVAAGIFFREGNVYFLIAMLAWPIARAFVARDLARLVAYGVVLCAGVAFTVAAQSVYGATGSQVADGLRYVKLRVSEPVEALKFVAAVSMTLGPFAYSLLRARSRAIGPMDDALVVSAAGLIVALAAAFAGGYDSTRIFFIAYPAYALLLGTLLARLTRGEGVALVACGAIANRFAFAIGESLPAGSKVDLTSYFALEVPYAPPLLTAYTLGFWAISFALIAALRSRTGREDGARSSREAAGVDRSS